MIKVHMYKQKLKGEYVVMVHFFNRAKYVKSTEKFTYDKMILETLLKGYSEVEVVQVANAYDLAYKVQTVKEFLR